MLDCLQCLLDMDSLVFTAELLPPTQLEDVPLGVGIEVKKLLGEATVSTCELTRGLREHVDKYYVSRSHGYILPPGVITCGKAWNDRMKARVNLSDGNKPSTSATARDKRRDNMSDASGDTDGYGARGAVKPFYPPADLRRINNAPKAGPCPAWTGCAIISVAILYVVLSMVLLYLFMRPR
jgi:hypothetical protein